MTSIDNSDLKTVFNKWITYKNYPCLDAKKFKELKKYFESKLGKFADTRRNNNNVYGFTGWKLSGVLRATEGVRDENDPF